MLIETLFNKIQDIPEETIAIPLATILLGGLSPQVLMWLNVSDSEMKQAIYSYHTQRGEFAELQTFLELTGKRSSGQIAFVQAQLDYAIQHQDSALHTTALDLYCKLLDDDIAALQAAEHTDPSCDNHVWICENGAKKNLALAVYAHRYGTAHEAQGYIQLMIQATDAIITQAPADLSAKDLQRRKDREKKPFKRSCKEKFQTYGLLHLLPANDGRNTPIKDAQQKEQDKMASDELHAQKRADMLKSYEKEHTLEATTKIQELHTLLEQ